MMFLTRFITGLIVGAALLSPNRSSPLIFSRTLQEPSVNSTIQSAPRTVQISVDTDASVLIENSDGKRIGLDFTTKKFVNEIPDARSSDRETSSTFILPAEKSGKPYKISVAGKSASAPAAILSMTGPGFIVGFRSLRLSGGQIQKVSISANGSDLSFTAPENGATPQLYLTTQSGRDQPSYRFEIVSPSLSIGKTITVNLDRENGKLYFKSDETKKSSFSVMMRRTNPGGARETYNHQGVSFGSANSYAMDFVQWDGKGDACFYDRCEGCNDRGCTRLKNEYLKPKE
jgi:hypothetical protein